MFEREAHLDDGVEADLVHHRRLDLHTGEATTELRDSPRQSRLNTHVAARAERLLQVVCSERATDSR
jgi:hypothetical protein